MPSQSYALKSTAIASVDYDPETETMEVNFVNGRSYTHEGVPENEVMRLVTARSPGLHYNMYIKGLY